MTLIAVSIDERNKLYEAVCTAYRRKHSSRKPRPSEGKNPREWPTLHLIATEMEGYRAAPAARESVKRFITGVTARPGLEGVLDPLAKYAGFVDYQTFVASCSHEIATRSMDRTERLNWAYRQAMLLRSAKGTNQQRLLAEVQAMMTQPMWQNDWLLAFVDLAHLPGYYGELVAACEEQGAIAEPLFATALLYLRAWQQADPSGCKQYADKINSDQLRNSASPFLRGRVAFVEWGEYLRLRPEPLAATILQRMRDEAPAYPPGPQNMQRPAFYNYFPAGYHFLVAETLFVNGQWEALRTWLEETEAYLARLNFQPVSNVFVEVLAIWQSVAFLLTGDTVAAHSAWEKLRPSLTNLDNCWLWDYYEVYWWLADLRFAVAGLSSSKQEEVRGRIADFAKQCQMPFFKQMEEQIAPKIN